VRLVIADTGPINYLILIGHIELLPLGEAAAIALATFLHADLLLMDERRGVSVAERHGLRVTGTLGVLDLAAERELVDFAQAIRELERTTFRRPVRVLNALLAKHQQRREA
jgi:predicted nucleic acid-binding protein